MRLLNAKTMKLHSFFQESTTPGYAILSHTWYEGEVLFEDLEDISRALLKPGFGKIEACCKEALREGLQFVWIDTCCIDKSSSAELSEAINSMYRWYQLAAVCFAYLRDVVHPGNGELEIEHSRWFRRAWTLQELLAPRYMTFYSTDWKYFGTRDSNKKVISEVTGVGEEYLSDAWNRDIYKASIAKRMSWAANREATRAEDIAYSLFGIFDVNMPLLYGEGQEKAFRRLQEEIMKSSDDHTLFACSSYHTGDVLAPSPAHFVKYHDFVPIASQNSQLVKPYSMTNIGLQISLPLMINASGIVWAALNCRIDGDFFHVLGIPLEKLGVKQYVRRINMNPTHLSVESLSNYVIEEIFIQPNKGNRSFTWQQRHLGFIFRSFPPHGIEIQEVYPRKFWQAQEKIIQGAHQTWIRKGDAESRSWHVCLRLGVGGANHTQGHVLLVLGIKFRSRDGENSVPQPWDTHDSIALPWCNLLSFPSAQERLQTFDMEFNYHHYSAPPKTSFRSKEHRGVCVSFNDGRPDSTNTYTPAFVDVMGQWMCVVSLKFSEKVDSNVGGA